MNVGGKGRILVFGLICRDYMVTTDGFPQENMKIRCTSCKPSFGGNCFNVMVNLQRLSNNSFKCHMISVLGSDMIQKECFVKLRECNIDPTYIEVVEGENSPFSYIIVNEKTRSRTCILTPIKFNERRIPRNYGNIFKDNDIQLCFFDHRYPVLFRSSILPFIQKCQIPLIFNYERRREPELKFEKLILEHTKILIGNGKLPDIFIDEESQYNNNQEEEEDNLLRMMKYVSNFPSIEMIILTQGEKGLLCMKKGDFIGNIEKVSNTQEIFELSSSKKKEEGKKKVFTYSYDANYQVKYVAVFPVDVVDTTGAGDATSAGVLYSLLNNFDLDTLLLFSCYCGSRNCEDYGTTNLNSKMYSDFQSIT